MTDFALRKAIEEDAPTILEFILALSVYERLADECVATEGDIRRTLFGNKRYAEVVLAEDASGPLGFALYFYHYSTFKGTPTLWLEDLFVHARARGRGIGKALLKELCKTAQQEGCGRVEWWVLDWNELSIEFYRSIGARPMDDWTVYRMDADAIRSFTG